MFTFIVIAVFSDVTVREFKKRLFLNSLVTVVAMCLFRSEDLHA